MMTDIPLWIRDMHILPLLLQELRWIPEQVLRWLSAVVLIMVTVWKYQVLLV